MKRKIVLIVILVGFLLIPTIFGLIVYLISGQPICPPDLKILIGCLVGGNVILSAACGGIVWAIIVINYLLREISKQEKK